MFEPVQHHFAAALLNPERVVPFSARRFAVYRNNVVVGLVDALATRFPATQRIVGEEFFRAMAQVYVRAHPPRSPLMMFYGDGFPDFIEGFESAADVPYLADVARLEAARTRAYHAADAVPADAGTLQSFDGEALAALRVVRHPSAEIVRSGHPIVTIWQMNAGGRDVQPIEDWCREDALVVRPRGEVEVRLLPAGGAAFLTALFAGLTLAEATDAARAEAHEFDLVANLAVLIAAGAASEFLSEREPTS
jgi:hypothetical protein